MLRGLPEGNTKLVLILARPWALDHWAGSSRIPSRACFTSSRRASWLRLFHGHELAWTKIYMYVNAQCINDMNATLIIKCTKNCKIKFTDSEQSCIPFFSMIKGNRIRL